MEIEKLAKALKALSNPNRLKIYLEIAASREQSFSTNCDISACGCPISKIMEKLNIGAPTVSHHLKELVNAGLIFTERQGKFLIARINEKALADVTRALNLEGAG
jgi:DNA-binding transcriptional ArsR family regulator